MRGLVLALPAAADGDRRVEMLMMNPGRVVTIGQTPILIR